MNSYVNLHMNSYVIAFLDMNTQKFTLRRLNFVLRLPTKRSQVTKCSRPMTKFCLTNPYKRTPNSQKNSPAAARFYLQISAKEHPNHKKILTPFQLVWFYH